MSRLVYFISDAHLGSKALLHRRAKERRLVHFLDEIKESASAIYMMGDMFDFWYEFKYVVPKGYTRFLGKLAELTDRGIEIHFFTGNHDVWCFDYLQSECGVIVHTEPMTTEILGNIFYLAHGDGMGDPSRSFRFLRRIFRNRFCQLCFSMLPTRWSMKWGIEWARRSMDRHIQEGIPQYRGEDNEYLVIYAKNHLKLYPSINYFVFGHRHIELDLMLSRESRLLFLGDWISSCSYAVFNGEKMLMCNYVEGEPLQTI